jgi:hypothetical protein
VTLFRELDALAAAVEADAEVAWRLTRVARRAEYELGGTAVDAFARLVRSEPRVVALLKDVDRAYEVIVRGGNRDYALAHLLKSSDKWVEVRAAILAGAARGEKRQIADVIEAMDNHFGARLAYAFDTVAEIPLGRSARKLAARASSAPAKAGAELLKEVVAAAKRADKNTRAALEKLGRYLSADDPAWSSLAELITQRVGKGGKGARQDVLRIAVEGKLGEHLALRTPGVWSLVKRSYRRAAALARDKVGEGWSVRLVDVPALGPTASQGLGELYDGSIWLVRKGLKGMEAMPVMLLQVKAGQVREAIAQISRDVHREFDAVVDFIDKSGNAVPHRIVHPDGFEAHRVLVAPRPPSAARIKYDLKPGIAVDFSNLPLTRQEMITVADLLTKVGRRRAQRTATKGGAKAAAVGP